ncbi:alpha/beta fold hydrolase [Nocardiopsis aegyptia]|uniref:Pimeloyl-ACP methyl ester carboxylesterase n=1 Tax=Nocardiopsis aegyptia TaxID=220378 RepID=A0A7Z0EUH7_9ACTN|nr:alpha/beta fold hydrolase [Nocardiopsis aegyptia]NYJ38172.1 pimeloyl-ACP methyl ester carboxylesterase [Nocardiopsis aegyptia]
MTTKTNAEPAGSGADGERTGRDTVRHFTIHHDGVTIPVSRGGRGRPLVLCPGLNSTQADLRELIALLRREHDVAAFDLRGHGFASAADEYTFDAFLGDLAAVLAEVHLPGDPVLVGYSLGADLAVHHASEHPGSVAGLVLVDGANPVPEPFVTGADLDEFRAMWEDLATANRDRRGTARQVSLTGREILDLNIEVDAVRSSVLDRYRRIDRPVSMVMSASIAGDDAGDVRGGSTGTGVPVSNGCCASSRTSP